MCPRACAFGPRTSPRNRSSAPSSPSSQATSTTDGSSDTADELAQDLVELVRPFEVHEVTHAFQLAHVEFAQLCRGDIWIELADDELHRTGKRADDIGRGLAVADRLQRGDEGLRVQIDQLLVRDALVVKELRQHHAPQSFQPITTDQLDRVRPAGAT